MKTAMKVAKTIAIEVPGLGKKIATAVKSDKRSVQILATAAGISDATLYNIMNERYAQVDIETIKSLEKVLDIDLEITI